MNFKTYSTEEFERKYTYEGHDLGLTFDMEAMGDNGRPTMQLRLWAPTASSVQVAIYTGGTTSEDLRECGSSEEADLQVAEADLLATKTQPKSIEANLRTLNAKSRAADARIACEPMHRDLQGTWVTRISSEYYGCYYTYLITVDGQTREVCDPYARTTGVNGHRAMLIDPDAIAPAGFADEKRPAISGSLTDQVIYELHLRDISRGPDAGIQNRGKFLGLAEQDTASPSGHATGLSHILELGATMVHILPFYDYGSVDEARLNTPQFNWGYDPANFNVPEGSYSTDPFHGEVRIRELKEMVMTLHASGLGVIMDVVYNHVYDADTFAFNQIVPGYFSRQKEDGTYSNGSGCGNDTASERSMVRKYIVDSIVYWTREYHIDGFRFDLVGLLDTQTISEAMTEARKVNPNVLFYGEGWTMDTAVTKEGIALATQTNASLLPGFAFFSDTLRDGLRGSVFDPIDLGYISGAEGLESEIQACFMGLPTWCPSPMQSINYASCHDNHTLFDRIALSCPGTDEATRIRMNLLAAAIVFLSQGTPFLQAGEELLRTKKDATGKIVENSFNSPDSVNNIDWSVLNANKVSKTFDYYKGLIALRKAHSILRSKTREEAVATITPLTNLPSGVTAFELHNDEERLFIAFNPNREVVTILVPTDYKNVYVYDQTASATPIAQIADIASTSKQSVTDNSATTTDLRQITVPGISALVLGC